MKWSVSGFNQLRLLNLQLDQTDSYILQWVMDFSSYPNLQTIEVDQKIYFWIKFSQVLEEFPFFKIHNTKSVAQRFEKYVKLGLLSKKNLPHKNGIRSYFKPEKALSNLFYDPNDMEDIKEYERVKNENIKTKNNNTSTTSKNPKNLNSQGNKKYQGYKVGSAQGDEYSSGIQYYPTTINSTTTNSLNEVDQLKNALKRELLATFNNFLDKNLGKLSHTNLSQEHVDASGFDERCPQSNNNVFGNKDNYSNNTDINKEYPTPQKEVSEFSFYKNIISKYYSPNCFSEDFWQKLDTFCITYIIEEKQLANYIDFVYKTVISKNPKSEVNYFYKVVTEPSYAALFFQQPKTKEIKKEIILHTCKCCNKDFNEALIYCPTCTFSINDEKSTSKLEEYKKYYKEQIEDTVDNIDFPKFEPNKYKNNKENV